MHAAPAVVPCVRCAVRPRAVPAAAAAGVCRHLSPGYARTGRPPVLYCSRRVPEHRKLWTPRRGNSKAAGPPRTRTTRPEHPALGGCPRTNRNNKIIIIKHLPVRRRRLSLRPPAALRFIPQLELLVYTSASNKYTSLSTINI